MSRERKSPEPRSSGLESAITQDGTQNFFKSRFKLRHHRRHPVQTLLAPARYTCFCPGMNLPKVRALQ
jgi:hypothetical protein